MSAPSRFSTRGCPTRSGATRFDVLWSRLKVRLGRLLLWLCAPGLIRDCEVEDSVSGCFVEVRVGVLFSRVSVNGRDFYFRRFSGKFDGTGSGCR